MSWAASRTPGGLCKRSLTLQEVLAAPAVAPVTTQYECARRADGAVSLIQRPARIPPRAPPEFPAVSGPCLVAQAAVIVGRAGSGGVAIIGGGQGADCTH